MIIYVLQEVLCDYTCGLIIFEAKDFKSAKLTLWKTLKEYYYPNLNNPYKHRANVIATNTYKNVIDKLEEWNRKPIVLSGGA